MIGLLFRLPFYIGLVVIGGLVVGYFTLAHRVTGSSLASSVAGQVEPSGGENTCRRHGTVWRCRIGNGSGGFDHFRVRVDGHCWDARGADRLHGCVGLLDQI